MLTMSTPKKPKKRHRSGKPLNVWIDAALRDALDLAVVRTRPRSTLKNVVEAAVEDYLTAQGLWPPPSQP